MAKRSNGATIEYILPGGRTTGGFAGDLLRNNLDVGYFRPYLEDDGKCYVSITRPSGRQKVIQVANAAGLRFQDWRLIDRKIIQIAKPRLQAIADLRSRGLVYRLPNGMAHTVLSYENMSDISEAIISMDPIRQSQSDRPVFDIVNLPLPIIHKDFVLPYRTNLASTNGGTRLDTTTLSLATRRVAEAAEQLLLGVLPSYSYAGSSVYGYTNYPGRLTKVLTAPTTGGWTPAVLVDELLEMVDTLQNQNSFGPYMVYFSPNWARFLNADYSPAKGDNTLLDRIQAIQPIAGTRQLDYLRYLTGNPFTVLMVQMSEEVIREIIGMEIQSVQWDSHGGFQHNFKVMCMMVPQLRCDQNGQTGILHGSVASS